MNLHLSIRFHDVGAQPVDQLTMICQRCLRRLTARPSPSFQIVPTISSASFTTTGARPSNPAPPAATSTSAAQPFSTPLTPSPRSPGASQPNKSSKTATKFPVSSVRAGTVLKGLNFLKNKPEPVALEDREYPDWLWTVLDSSKAAKADGSGGGGTGDEGDLFAKSKKQRQKAAKAQRRQALLNPGALAPKIPIYEQSVDLPAGDGGLQASLDAGVARRELTRAMRQKRKAAIKEDNFLRSMR
nr:54s ribosomal protein l37, mitochondrial [Quercus suber]